MALPKEQRQIFFQPGSADTGQASTLSRLTSELQRFQQTAASSLADIRQTEGAVQAAGVSDTDQLKTDIGAFNKAFNSVVRKNYLLGLHNDTRDDVAAKTKEFSKDPQAFSVWFKEYKKGVLGGVDASVYDSASKGIDELGRAAESSIITAVHKANLENAKDDLDLNLTRARDSIMVSLAAEDEGTYIEQFVEYEALVGEAVQAGFMTEAEGKGKIIALQKQADATSIQLNMDRAYDEGRGIGYISSIIDQKVLPGFAPEEKDKLVSSLLTRYGQRASIEEKERTRIEAVQKATYDNGYRFAVDRFIKGELDLNTIEEMNRHGFIDPKVAKSLSTSMNHGGVQFDDSDRLLYLEANLDHLSDDDIIGEGLITNDSKRRLLGIRRESERSWRTAPNIREGLRQINVALGLPEPGSLFGTGSKADLKLAGETTTKFYERLEMIPLDQRPSQAVDVAKDIIRTELVGPARTDVSDAEAYVGQLEQLLSDQQKVDASDHDIRRTTNSLSIAKEDLELAKQKLSELE